MAGATTATADEHGRPDQPAQDHGRDRGDRRQRRLGQRVEPVEGARAGPPQEVGDVAARRAVVAQAGAPRHSPSSVARHVSVLEQPLALREAGLRASRHGRDDQVDHEEGHDLVDRVATAGPAGSVAAWMSAPAWRKAATRKSVPPPGHAAEHVGADRRADERRHDAGHHPGHDDVGHRQVASHEEQGERSRGRMRRRSAPISQPRMVNERSSLSGLKNSKVGAVEARCRQ